jgi:hypothetical protein
VAMDLQVAEPRKTEMVEGGRKAHGDSSPVCSDSFLDYRHFPWSS